VSERDPWIDIEINTPKGRRGFDLSDHKQAREFFDNFIVGPFGQTIGFFNMKDGTQLKIADMTDEQIVGYAYMVMRMTLECHNH
jgi:hypothetical protein